MVNYQVDPTDLLNAQNAAAAAVQGLNRVNGNVVNALGVVSQGWVSSASTAYQAALNGWTGEYNLLVRTLQEIEGMLGVTATQTQRTNNANLESASAITTALKGR